MTPKSTGIAVAVVAAGAGLFVAAWWWTTQPPSRPSLADYTADRSLVHRDLPATRPSGRMALPWSAGSAAAGPAVVPSGPSAGPPAVAVAGLQQPLPVMAAGLPWGQPTRARPAAATPPDDTTRPPPTLADTAGQLKFSARVAAWLGAWEQKTKANAPDASDGVAEFERLLAIEPTTDTQLLSLLRATQSVDYRPGGNRHSEPFGPVSGAVACQAVRTGTDQVRQDARRRYVAMRNLAPLIERLWYGPDRDLRAVGAFYQTLAEGEAEGSSDWIRGHVAQSEALFKRGRPDDALAMLARVDPVSTPAMAQWAWKIEFDRGQYLIGASRFGEAADRFRHIIASEKNPMVRADAKALLVVACAKSGDLETALDEFAALRDAGQSSQYRVSAFAAIKALKQAHAEGPLQ